MNQSDQLRRSKHSANHLMCVSRSRPSKIAQRAHLSVTVAVPGAGPLFCHFCHCLRDSSATTIETPPLQIKTVKSILKTKTMFRSLLCS